MSELINHVKPRGPAGRSPGSYYRGVAVGQRREAFTVLEKIIEDYKPELIVEIGYWHGGLSLFLSDVDVCPVYSFDINKDEVPNTITDETLLNLNFLIRDCWTQETKDFIHELSKGKKTLWLIDGGDKEKEFNFYSDIVKAGEIIMAHDFAPDSDGANYLKQNNIWYWWESKLEGLDLTNFSKHEDFENIWKSAVWGAFVKNG